MAREAIWPLFFAEYQMIREEVKQKIYELFASGCQYRIYLL